MKLATALKEKNKIVKKIKTLQQRIQNNNSILEGNTRQYEPEENIFILESEIQNLISLKHKIASANSPIQCKIIEMGEMKTYIVFLRSIDTKDGKQYSFRESQVTYESQISEKEISEMIEKIEIKIERIQEEIDSFNHSTEI